MGMNIQGGVLDTSVLIGGIHPTAATTGGLTVSVISIGELIAGVRRARDAAERASRQSFLAWLRSEFVPLPVDVHVAEQYGEILATARTEGRPTKATDLLILATAAATGRALITRDESQAKLALRIGVPVF